MGYRVGPTSHSQLACVPGALGDILLRGRKGLTEAWAAGAGCSGQVTVPQVKRHRKERAGESGVQLPAQPVQ